MLKSALGVFFSLLVIIHAPIAQAKEPSTTAAKKTVVKKSTVKKTSVNKAKTPKAASKNGAATRKSSVQASKTSSKSAKRGASKQRENVSLNSDEKLVKKTVVVRGKQKVIYQRVAKPVVPIVPPVMTAGDIAGLSMTRDTLALASSVALILDQSSSEVLFEKNANVTLPIASITKLMTGLVVVEAQQDMNEILEVTDEDVDREKNSSSRLRVGSQLSRANMLHIALMSSENRAASALGRHYPGGIRAFVAAMNAKAKSLGMTGTHYVDSTGLSSNNVASARDLAKLVMAAYHHPILCQYSTDTKYVVEPGGRSLQYANSNRLVTNPDWEIGIQKTGYISEAGRCLVMQTNINGRPIVMIFLDSKGKFSRLADAARIRKWLETKEPQNVARKHRAVES
ncbi:D-alanyl-D-alanine endopeptidase [Herminiimonas fonticola]|uniref:D-alanyl-D-alanine endopeptidase (Penicillin-binding protein 7) n=1 Tax=Herminiimonas fonticola TaxID=303380 RepID=A0A4R6G5K7_9BURK|nr:D-alanyl-D-alanine endopeptidase [Herminiimonas fonticola]RBA23710.1 D-alanyl-D-alanine carboxypeptidase [Herminiimonas fonticola]TDN89712.1 D-alanyl-D-alanine endopeptidase (penicillin-binding protein 7) [Herminiimonas fonticola]